MATGVCTGLGTGACVSEWWGGGEGERSQEVWRRGKLLNATLAPSDRLCITMGAGVSRWTASLLAGGGGGGRGGRITTVSINHNLGRERATEADSNRRLSAYQPRALPPRQTSSHRDDWESLQFSSVQDGIYAFDKTHKRPTPPRRHLSDLAFEFGLLDWRCHFLVLSK